MAYRGIAPDRPFGLRVKGTTNVVAEITGAQLDDLLNALVPEHNEDTDYFIDRTTLRYLEERGADPDLIRILAQQVGEGEGIDLEWVELDP